jgi:hypothetical protein
LSAERKAIANFVPCASPIQKGFVEQEFSRGERRKFYVAFRNSFEPARRTTLAFTFRASECNVRMVRPLFSGDSAV